VNVRQERRALAIVSLIIAAFSLTTSLAVLAVASTLVTFAPPQRLSVLVPACPTEDSTNCYWDADSRGNGVGQDFMTFTIDHEDVVFPTAP
jgi:hypothetical protein